jgi:adenylate kinase family enzyme
LGGLLALPVIHLDKEFWNAGWVQTPKDEWYSKQNELFTGGEWIADGNYDGSMDIRLSKADTVIFLDYNRLVCMCGVVKRFLKNIGRTRPDMAEGCREKIDYEFAKWIWRFPYDSRPKILEKLSKYDNFKLIVIKNRRELKNFIKTIGGVS